MKGTRVPFSGKGSDTYFIHVPGRGPSGRVPSEWQELRLEEMPDAMRDLNLSGRGVAEITDDPASDLKHIVISPERISGLYPEFRTDDALYMRSIPRAGREFYSIFTKWGSMEYLGTIEMLENPPADWLLDRKATLSGEGDVFCSPTMTLPLEMYRPLLITSFNDMRDREEGVHTYRWLCEPSLCISSIEHVNSGFDTYSKALSFMSGRDLSRPGSSTERLRMPSFGNMPLTESFRGFFAGTLPGEGHPGHLLGARSVELALSMLLGVKDSKSLPSVARLEGICRSMNDDGSLFDLIERSEMDPFFLQKLFKLNKAKQRTDMMPLFASFPDTRTINLIASSRRRGLSTDDICSLTGMDRVALRSIERTFGIEPRIEPAVDLDGGCFTPYILSWPEPSLVMQGDRGNDEFVGVDGISITDTFPGSFRSSAVRGILFASFDDDVFDALKERYPGLMPKTTAK